MFGLAAREVEALCEPGMPGDGDGLYLRVGPTGAKSWVLGTVVHGKRRELGLGSVDVVPLAEAREKARTSHSSRSSKRETRLAHCAASPATPTRCESGRA